MKKDYNRTSPTSSARLARGGIFAFGIIVSLSPMSVLGQDMTDKFGVEFGVSTLGVYVGPNYKINDQLTARLPLYLGSLASNQTVDGNDVNGKLDSTSAAIMADYHPFRGAFRVSGGMGFGGYDLSGSITNPEFDGTTYTGVVDVGLTQTHDVVPIISIGYAKTFNNGFGVLAELGAKIGTYTLTASDDAIPAADKAQFAADVAQVNSDLQDLGAIPFITLGLSYKF
jgi:hypothetical protein